MSDWERTGAAVCVVCPDCAFTFDAAHENGDGTGYSCPLCGEQRAERARDAAEREVEALRAVAEAARNRDHDADDRRMPHSPDAGYSSWNASCGLCLALAALDAARKETP